MVERRAEVLFSRHSRQRMAKRGVAFSAPELERIQRALHTLARKGSRMAVVLLDGAALVVSVMENTVVTVVESSRLREQVFTQIDSAIVA